MIDLHDVRTITTAELDPFIAVIQNKASLRAQYLPPSHHAGLCASIAEPLSTLR